jgi:hypothetical protein
MIFTMFSLLEILGIRGQEVNSSRESVDEWLHRISIHPQKTKIEQLRI